MTETHELSQTAFDRLKAEVDDLKSRGRIDIAKKIEVARELGDLSENGDYHAAKEEQGKMEGRILHLQRIVDNAVIVERTTGGESVTTGSVVTIRYEGDDHTEQYLIGSIEERHGDLDVISPGSPLGGSLIGAAAGDVVSFEAPGGELNIEVVEIH